LRAPFLTETKKEKWRFKMKKRALVSLVLLVSILMVMAETVIFQEDPIDPVPHCVDGRVQVFNPETGEWDKPNLGETVSIKIYQYGNNSIYDFSGPVTIVNGYYCYNFSSYVYASLCDKVRIFFRGQYYYGDYNHSTGTTVDIMFYPDR
jgi:hypothetical protein